MASKAKPSQDKDFFLNMHGYIRPNLKIDPFDLRLLIYFFSFI